MPREGPLRRRESVRLSVEEKRLVQEVADREHPIPGRPHGNLSEAIRTLCGEALDARERQADTKGFNQ